MASPAKLYQREMHDNLGFFATWLPGDGIQIGDAGVLEGGRFRRMASLDELGIPFEVQAGGAQQDVRYTSTSGTTLRPSAGLDAEVLGKASMTIEFSRAGAFVFHASSLRARALQNRMAVGEQLVKRYEEGRWDKDWLLVDAVHVAEGATILVSQDKSAGLTLAADVAGDLAGLSLADAAVGLTVVATRGTVVQIVGGRRVHPLYTCIRLTDRLFGAPTVHPVRGTGQASFPPAFSRPAIDDLLTS